MDLNAFIFRDDTADILGTETDSDGFGSAAEARASALGAMTALQARAALAAGGGAILGSSHSRGDGGRQI
jgi:hypothetical protein